MARFKSMMRHRGRRSRHLFKSSRRRRRAPGGYPVGRRKRMRRYRNSRGGIRL